jgi:hypothetical protein
MLQSYAQTHLVVHLLLLELPVPVGTVQHGGGQRGCRNVKLQGSQGVAAKKKISHTNRDSLSEGNKTSKSAKRKQAAAWQGAGAGGAILARTCKSRDAEGLTPRPAQVHCD